MNSSTGQKTAATRLQRGDSLGPEYSSCTQRFDKSEPSPDVLVFLQVFLPLLYSSKMYEWPQGAKLHQTAMEWWVLQRLSSVSTPEKGAALYRKYHAAFVEAFRTVQQPQGFFLRSHFGQFLSHLCINALAWDVFESDNWHSFVSEPPVHSVIFSEWCRILKEAEVAEGTSMSCLLSGSDNVGEIHLFQGDPGYSVYDESSTTSLKLTTEELNNINGGTSLPLEKPILHRKKRVDDSCFVENVGEFLALGNYGEEGMLTEEREVLSKSKHGDSDSVEDAGNKQEKPHSPSKTRKPTDHDHLGVKIEGLEGFLALEEAQTKNRPEAGNKDSSSEEQLVDGNLVKEESVRTKMEPEGFRFKRTASIELELDEDSLEEATVTKDPPAMSRDHLARNRIFRGVHAPDLVLTRDEDSILRNDSSDDESNYVPSSRFLLNNSRTTMIEPPVADQRNGETGKIKQLLTDDMPQTTSWRVQFVTVAAIAFIRVALGKLSSEKDSSS